MKIRSVTKGALVALLLAAVPLTSALAAHRSEAEQAIAEAKASQEKASAAGAAVDTSDLIKQAEGLLPSRQYTKAIEVANQAKKQSEFALSQTGAGGGAAADPGKKAEAEKAIADAEAARKKAASVKGEWRDTKKMIKQAEDLVKAGDYDQAIKTANKAKRQGELGYEQALGQKGVGFPSYVLHQMQQ
jgi:hypothetical protein